MNTLESIQRTIYLKGKAYDCQTNINLEIREWRESRGEHFGTPCSELMREVVAATIETLTVKDSEGETVDDEAILSEIENELISEYE